jgi:hypothetical protein
MLGLLAISDEAIDSKYDEDNILRINVCFIPFQIISRDVIKLYDMC